MYHVPLLFQFIIYIDAVMKGLTLDGDRKDRSKILERGERVEITWHFV